MDDFLHFYIYVSFFLYFCILQLLSQGGAVGDFLYIYIHVSFYYIFVFCNYLARVIFCISIFMYHLIILLHFAIT